MAIWSQGKSAVAQKSQCVFGTLLIDIFLWGNRMYTLETYHSYLNQHHTELLGL